MAGGNIGGIEILMKDYAKYSCHENHFMMIWGNHGSATELIKKQHCKVTELNTTGRKSLDNFKIIEQYCKKYRIEAVIAHHAAPLAHLYLMYIKRRIPQIITVAYAHGNAADMCRANEKHGLFLRKWILSRSLKRADLVVAISKSVSESLIEWFCTPEERIKVIYNGTDLSVHKDIFPAARDAVVRLIFVGRLIEMKGVQLTLKALAQMKTKCTWHFNVVGDGVYREPLEKLCRELGLQDQVTFLGERLDVPRLLADADIFVHMPYWEEGFGITIIEAMAAGLICVCGDGGAIPEIITDGQNGFLVKKHDVNALAERLETEIKECRDQNRIRLCAKNRAEEFSAEAFAEQLDKTLLENRKVF